jgi:hypothetical protein
LKPWELLVRQYRSLEVDRQLTGQLRQLEQQKRCHKGQGQIQDTPGGASRKELVQSRNFEMEEESNQRIRNRRIRTVMGRMSFK